MIYKTLALLSLLLISSESNKTLDFDYFSMETHDHWEYIPQRGIDSFVGSIDIGSGNTLSFDYGPYSSSLTGKDYDCNYDTIANLKAKICIPKKAGKGLTAVYFEKTSNKYSGTKLTIGGTNLTSQNQKAFLEAIKTLKFKE